MLSPQTCLVCCINHQPGPTRPCATPTRRQVPHKRKLGAVVAVGGSSGWAFLRWLTGQWWPSWNQLITNRFFAIYVVVSAAIGAGATYLYDDPHNPKVNTLIKVSSLCMHELGSG